MAQGILHLKGEGIGGKVSAEGPVSRIFEAKGLDLSRRHVLITPQPDRAVEAREWLDGIGAPIVAALPGETLLVVLPVDQTPPADMASLQELSRANKLSPDVTAVADAEGYLVVEFHPDVEVPNALLILNSFGLTMHEHPDLAPHHLLVEGSYSSAIGLADWDEVAYVFEATPEMAAGGILQPCVGFSTAGGSIAQYIATVGDGWDGPGRNAAALTYSYQSFTTRQPQNAVAANIEKALAEWSKAAALTFTPTTRLNGPRNLNFLFAEGEHGDGYPFDGPGKVLAHTFYPALPNPEPLAGDLHFDATENWNIGGDIDIFSVVLHELGHALGLGHSDKPGAVMYPYYKRVSTLSAEDISSVLQLYAAPSAATPVTPLTLTIQDPGNVSVASVDLTGTVTGGSGDVRVTWSDAHSHSGSADGGRIWRIAGIPLAVGANPVTVRVQDSAGGAVNRTVIVTRVDVAAPRIAIASPSSGTVYQAQVTVAGTGVNVNRVVWMNSRGGQGGASGTTVWSAAIPLVEGDNILTFTGTSATGQSTSITLSLTYARQQDTTAPSVTILNPTQSIVRTSANTFSVNGSASDNVGVAEVRWSTNFGYSGLASGTKQWTTSGIPLLVGDNVITIRAKDAAGNAGWRSFTVVRR